MPSVLNLKRIMQRMTCGVEVFVVRGRCLADTRDWTCCHITPSPFRKHLSSLICMFLVSCERSARGRRSPTRLIQKKPKSSWFASDQSRTCDLPPQDFWPPYQLLYWRFTTPEEGQAKPHRRSSFRIGPSGFAGKFPVGINCLHHRHHPPLLTIPNCPQKVFDLA